MNRTPPGDSLAADILNAVNTFSKTKLAVEELKDNLSDFTSCLSEMSSQGTSSAEEADVEREVDDQTWVTMNDWKRKKRNKRKLSMTPDKEDFMKKPPKNF